MGKSCWFSIFCRYWLWFIQVEIQILVIINIQAIIQHQHILRFLLLLFLQLNFIILNNSGIITTMELPLGILIHRLFLLILFVFIDNFLFDLSFLDRVTAVVVAIGIITMEWIRIHTMQEHHNRKCIRRIQIGMVVVHRIVRHSLWPRACRSPYFFFFICLTNLFSPRFVIICADHLKTTWIRLLFHVFIVVFTYSSVAQSHVFLFFLFFLSRWKRICLIRTMSKHRNNWVCRMVMVTDVRLSHENRICWNSFHRLDFVRFERFFFSTRLSFFFVRECNQPFTIHTGVRPNISFHHIRNETKRKRKEWTNTSGDDFVLMLLRRRTLSN